jgi:hypothetical protein
VQHDTDNTHSDQPNGYNGSMRALLIGLFTVFCILFATVAFTKEKKIYTDEDLSNYKSEEKSSGKYESTCDFLNRMTDECSKGDLECQIYWGRRARDFGCFRSPVPVRIVP